MVSKKKQAKLARQAARNMKNAERVQAIDQPTCSRYYNNPNDFDDASSICSDDSFFSNDSDRWEDDFDENDPPQPGADGMPSFRDILRSFHLVELLPIECGFTEFLMSPSTNSTEVLNRLLPAVIENMKFPDIDEKLKSVRIQAFEVFAGFFFRLMKFVTHKVVAGTEEGRKAKMESEKTVKQILSYDARERATAWYKRIKETEDADRAERGLWDFKNRVATIYENLCAYRDGKQVNCQKPE